MTSTNRWKSTAALAYATAASSRRFGPPFARIPPWRTAAAAATATYGFSEKGLSRRGRVPARMGSSRTARRSATPKSSCLRYCALRCWRFRPRPQHERARRTHALPLQVLDHSAEVCGIVLSCRSQKVIRCCLFCAGCALVDMMRL
jgi:hypothetical protein